MLKIIFKPTNNFMKNYDMVQVLAKFKPANLPIGQTILSLYWYLKTVNRTSQYFKIHFPSLSMSLARPPGREAERHFNLAADSATYVYSTYILNEDKLI